MQRKLLPHARAMAAQDEADGRDTGDAADPVARVAEVLDWLEANRYLSQQRFVESRIHVRAARHGNLRIQQELAQHGLALDPDAAQSLKASEIDRARDVWSRKFDTPAADAAGRARQARLLTRRGVSAAPVRRGLGESGRGAPGDKAN